MLENQMQPVELRRLQVFAEADGAHIMTAEVGIIMPSEEGVNAKDGIVIRVKFPVDVTLEALAQILERTRFSAIAALSQATSLLEHTGSEAFVYRMPNGLPSPPW